MQLAPHRPATKVLLFSSLSPPPLPGRPSQEPLQRGPGALSSPTLGEGRQEKETRQPGAGLGRLGRRGGGAWLSLQGPRELMSWRSPPPVPIWQPEGFGLWLSGTWENLPSFPHHTFVDPKASRILFGLTSDLCSRDLEAFSNLLTRWGGLGSWVGSEKELRASLRAPRDPHG